MCTCHVFIHEMHCLAPVQDVVHDCWRCVGSGIRSGWLRDRAVHAATSDFRGRPRGRLRGTTTPWTNHSPPQTPHGSRRSRAPARHARRAGQSWQRVLAYSTSAGASAKKSSGSFTRHGSCRRRAARRGRTGCPALAVEHGELHRGHLLVLFLMGDQSVWWSAGHLSGLSLVMTSWLGRTVRRNKKAADPGFRDSRPWRSRYGWRYTGGLQERIPARPSNTTTSLDGSRALALRAAAVAGTVVPLTAT